MTNNGNHLGLFEFLLGTFAGMDYYGASCDGRTKLSRDERGHREGGTGSFVVATETVLQILYDFLYQ